MCDAKERRESISLTREMLTAGVRLLAMFVDEQVECGYFEGYGTPLENESPSEALVRAMWSAMLQVRPNKET